MTAQIQTAAGRQVITIAPDGSLSGLQVKPGKGVDLRQFGRADIQRASEIIFCPVRQQWYVELRHAGKYAGTILTVSLLLSARGGSPTSPDGAEDPVAYWDDYDDAVQGEIDYLNYLRLNDPDGLQAVAYPG